MHFFLYISRGDSGEILMAVLAGGIHCVCASSRHTYRTVDRDKAIHTVFDYQYHCAAGQHMGDPAKYIGIALHDRRCCGIQCIGACGCWRESEICAVVDREIYKMEGVFVR